MAASYIGVQKRFNKSTDQVKWYFDQFEKLLPDFPYQVTLAYLFFRTETAQNRALYFGIVKLHRAHTEIANSAINTHHMTREGFLGLFKNVFGTSLSTGTAQKIKKAEEIRDKVVHGKLVGDPELREAIIDVIEYAEAMNKEICDLAGFEPFGDGRGNKGAGKALDKSTTRWLLKGLGFGIA